MKERLRASDYRFILVSNREPYVHRYSEGEIECEQPASGLTVALEPIMCACGGTWIAHGSGDAVINLQGRVFLPQNDDPFRVADALLARTKANVVLVDMHAEATSEKVAMGWYLDGRATAVLGTHTHIPTADTRILPGGTAYQTDVGMTGPYDSVIGVQKELVIQRFLTNMPARWESAHGDVHFCGVYLECDESNGHATAVERIMIPGRQGASL